MQNYSNYDDKSIYGNQRVKIFTGLPAQVEQEINKFITNEPMWIKEVLQSESSTDREYSITVTIFYETPENKIITFNDGWKIKSTHWQDEA